MYGEKGVGGITSAPFFNGGFTLKRTYKNVNNHELIITEIKTKEGCLIVPKGGTVELDPEMYLKLRETYGFVLDEAPKKAPDPADILGGKTSGKKG